MLRHLATAAFVRRRGAPPAILALGIATVLIVRPASAADPAQAAFPTPEAAIASLRDALAAGDEKRLLDLFGHDQAEFITGGDRAAAKVEHDRVLAAMKIAAVVRPAGDARAVIDMGRTAWPFPIPLVKEQRGWRFDTEAGKEEVTNRRIGRNELAAIAVCRAFMDAQLEYASVDRDGDGVLEYAQVFASTAGRRDGLYWQAATGEQASPFGPTVARAGRYLTDRKAGDPFLGYHFRVLTRQGAQAPGGAHDYVVNGNMIAGFAMVASPAEYGISGIMTIMCSHHGQVLEKDLGDDTETVAAAMTAYEPDETWVEAKE